MTDDDIITHLEHLLHERRKGDDAGSYTAGLLHGDEDSLLKKITEESAELILAAKAGDGRGIREESADVLFHLLIVLARYNVTWQEILRVLEKRKGVGGLREKQQRTRK